VAAEIGDEDDALAVELRLDVQAGREQGVDSERGHGREP